MQEIAKRTLTRLGAWTASPIAFGAVCVYGVIWITFEHDTFDFHSGATLATWFMTLFIQRASHRDTQALHAKMDELLHASKTASDRATRLDDKEPEEIEEHREDARAGDAPARSSS